MIFHVGLLIEPTSLPLSVGILAGLMSVPFSGWIEHWVGLFHAYSRKGQEDGSHAFTLTLESSYPQRNRGRTSEES